jgi:hypothetical protein
MSDAMTDHTYETDLEHWHFVTSHLVRLHQYDTALSVAIQAEKNTLGKFADGPRTWQKQIRALIKQRQNQL